MVKKHEGGIKIRVIIDNKYNEPLREINSSQLNKLSQQERLRYQELFTLVDINEDGSLSQTEINQKDALSILEDV